MQSWSVMRFLRRQVHDTYPFLCCRNNLQHQSLRLNHLYPRRTSQLLNKFENIKSESSELASKSHKLFVEQSIISQAHPGGFHILPLGQRVLEKLITIIDEEMDQLGAQKLSLTTLAPKALWTKTDRWKEAGKELMKIEDRNAKEYCLGPTHEEIITSLVSDFPLSKAVFPLMLYQITRKFRDESHPRFGLLRGREFEMKDMYTFDITQESAKETYESVCKAYENLFHRLELPFLKAEADVGKIGGVLSHEFHLEAPVGEDIVYKCSECGVLANEEITEYTDEKTPKCSKCESEHLTKLSCIEVGHSFLLGTKYSSVFGLTHSDQSASKKAKKPVEMGCYGLGVTRIMQAAVEVLSDGKKIKWPKPIVPYKVAVLPQKEGYRFDEFMELAGRISNDLNNMGPLRGDVIIDDRTNKSIGKRAFDMAAIGIPYAVVVAKIAEDPKDKVFKLESVDTGEQTMLSETELKDKLFSIYHDV